MFWTIYFWFSSQAAMTKVPMIFLEDVYITGLCGQICTENKKLVRRINVLNGEIEVWFLWPSRPTAAFETDMMTFLAIHLGSERVNEWMPKLTQKMIKHSPIKIQESNS